jgi:hypothetical protein
MASPLQHIAGIHVGDRQREEDKPDRKYGNVHHGSALRMRVCARKVGFYSGQQTSCNGDAFDAVKKGPIFACSPANSCHALHRNSRGRRPKTYRNLIKTRTRGGAPAKLLKPLSDWRAIPFSGAEAQRPIMEKQSGGIELPQNPNSKNHHDRHKSRKSGAIVVSAHYDSRDLHRNQDERRHLTATPSVCRITHRNSRSNAGGGH